MNLIVKCYRILSCLFVGFCWTEPTLNGILCIMGWTRIPHIPIVVSLPAAQHGYLHTSTDTSAPSSTSPGLAQILLISKPVAGGISKPRTAPPDDPDNPEHWSARRPRRGFLIRPISTLQMQKRLRLLRQTTCPSTHTRWVPWCQIVSECSCFFSVLRHHFLSSF